MKKTIYIFGNPSLDFDNLPIKLKPKLKEAFPNFEFILKDPNENLHPENDELIIIDTVVGPEKIIILDNLEEIDKIETSPNYSMHDFDLGFNLKLLKKIGSLKKVTIFGVPSGMDKDEALKKLKILIEEKLKF